MYRTQVPASNVGRVLLYYAYITIVSIDIYEQHGVRYMQHFYLLHMHSGAEAFSEWEST